MKNRIGNWIWILLLFTLALILRLVLLRYRHCIETDGVAYVAIARGLIQHGTLEDTLFPPFYPALLGLTSLLVGDYELSGRIISAIAGSLLVIPVFLLGERLYSRRIGYLAATLVVFYPALVEFSTYVLTESSYTFLFTCVVLATLVAFKRQRWPFFAISGVLLGLGYLIRPEALGYLPYLLLVYIGAYLFVRKDRDFPPFPHNAMDHPHYQGLHELTLFNIFHPHNDDQQLENISHAFNQPPGVMKFGV